jgi:2-keto-3-deoxy-L-rhamnonate aldolase RhmA
MNRLHKAIAAAGGRPLLGAALYFYDPIFLEISAHMGFNVVWIEMEHGHITFAEAADLCRMAAGRNMLTFIRICDTRRENILKALECGPDILDVPMVDTADTARELVHFAQYPPHGARGAFSISRALDYGFVDNIVAAQQHLNEDLSLLVQIETREALDNIEDIAAVPGVDLFVGPSDLASSLGFTAQTGHPTVREACVRIVETARRHGKKVVTMCPPSDFEFWVEQGIDMVFVINDITALKTGAKVALDAANLAIEKNQAASKTPAGN